MGSGGPRTRTRPHFRLYVALSRLSRRVAINRAPMPSCPVAFVQGEDHGQEIAAVDRDRGCAVPDRVAGRRVGVMDKDDYRGMMWWVTIAGRRQPGGCMISIAFLLLIIVAIVEGWFW